MSRLFPLLMNTGSSTTLDDRRFMQRALELAARGRWTAPPNPAVGAVVVVDGRIVGEGFHERPGTPHAEVVALTRAGSLASGGTIYITLEPCNHHGRTPPCTDAILVAGIKRVVVAGMDPHRLVNGEGLERLRREAIEVVEGVERDVAEKLNERHFLAAREGRPTVIGKLARTLDGRIGRPGRQQLAITGDDARVWTGRRRSEVEAVLVGSGTLLADDPLLTARGPGTDLLATQPARVVADGRLRTPPGARILSSEGGPVYILTTAERAGGNSADRLVQAGARVVGVDADAGDHLKCRDMLSALAAAGFDSIFVEGGATLMAALAGEDLIDLWHIWIAPTVIGNGPGALSEALEPPVRLGEMDARRVGDDLLVSVLPQPKV